MTLKDTLKLIKLNESTITTVLGGLVVLVVGMMLVNYLKGRTAPPLVAPAGQTAQGQTSLPKTHKVSEGEYLWKIAETYYKSGYNWVDIAGANNLKNPNFLAVGQELTIPDVPAKISTTDTGQISSTKAPGPVIEGDSYTIEQGDHLWAIAIRAYQDGYRWVDIARENKVPNPNLIYPGQKLSLPRRE